jgi:hypothetical protein
MQFEIHIDGGVWNTAVSTPVGAGSNISVRHTYDIGTFQSTRLRVTLLEARENAEGNEVTTHS